MKLHLMYTALIYLAYHHDGFSTSALNISMSAGCRKTSRKLNSIPSSVSRRHALTSAAVSIAGVSGFPTKSYAELPKAETVDIVAVKAAQSKTASIPGIKNSVSTSANIVTRDPSPLLSIRGGMNGKSSIKIPRVGYSLYKTSPEIAGRCTALAIRSGVRHFDVGTLYGSNNEIAGPLKQYLDDGIDGINFSAEKPELLSVLDATKMDGDKHALATISSGLLSTLAPAPSGSAGRRGRREGLFLSHKVANSEQSTKRIDVRRAVKSQIAALGTQYLDLVSIHSPLTDRGRRLESYGALIELRDAGLIKAVGVCNYGLGPLNELKDYGFDLPSINQLELSPFNTHSKVQKWCKDNNVALACGAWSKLSGADGPQDQWAVVSEIAKRKDMTKAQVLVRWSLQKGYICVPRSSAASKVERLAIAENSYGGVNKEGASYLLTDEEMIIIDGLDLELKAGKLGRRDGWNDADVTGVDWDPTDFI